MCKVRSNGTRDFSGTADTTIGQLKAELVDADLAESVDLIVLLQKGKVLADGTELRDLARVKEGTWVTTPNIELRKRKC